ncbi:SufS family cysteine desulfurase, partial [bacterium]|nr:SufS family cysteine desulfurase [bacterium]MBR2273828.1 SufS family cysteine desulfurase [Alphaproteobacteria bacterium]
MFDAYEIRKDFPSLGQLIDGKRNTYLDTAASAQKPLTVLKRIEKAYKDEYANVHRGSYRLSELATENYESSREIVAKFIHATNKNEVIFTRNATEGINLVAATFGWQNLKPGDEVLLSVAEHHANLVTWQQWCLRTGATLKYFDLDEDGSFNWENFANALNSKTKIVAVTAMSNVLGTIFPVKKICQAAHAIGAKVLIDACQFAVHKKIDVTEFDCDFLAFSGHKLYGPTGIGVLYAKYDLLKDMPPYQFGGDMIEHVYYDKTSFALPPAKFEAGTPAIVQAIGLGEALRYLMQFDFEDIEKYEQALIDYTTQILAQIPELKIVGTAQNKGGVFSFAVKNIHPQDLAFVLGKEGVAVRTGHFCAEPIVRKLGYTSLTRASLGIYSVKEDIDVFVKALYKAKEFFR